MSKEVEDHINQENEYNDKLHKYYELKSKYDKSIHQKKQDIKKIAKASGMSKKDKRNMFLTYTPKCISCNRDVGTKFNKIKQNSHYHLTATCGNTSQPCKLDIDIDLGTVVNTISEKEEHEKRIDDCIKEIIITKNDELFGFITEDDAVSKFDILNTKLDDATDYYRSLINHYGRIIFNKERETKIDKLTKTLNSQILTIKKNINEYNKTYTRQFIKDAVELYVTDMANTINILNNTKYDEMRVEYNIENKEYILLQTKILPSNFILPGDNEIKKFVIGKYEETVVPSKEESSVAPSAISENITDMSARNLSSDAVNENVPFIPVSVEEKSSDKESNKDMAIAIDSDSSSSYAPPPPEDEYESDIDDNISDVSSDTSSVSENVPLKIGDNIDSDTDSFIPPPPPLNEENSNTNTPEYSPTSPAYSPDSAENTDATSTTSNSNESVPYSPYN
jgi:hypothetical protein